MNRSLYPSCSWTKRLMILVFVCLLVVVFQVEAKAPQLTPTEVRSKIEEILKVHVVHKKLTPELLRRTFHNFIDELDPMKCYFVGGELDPWLHPSEDLLHTALTRGSRGDYSDFYQIYDRFEQAVLRRNQLEQKILEQELPKDVHSDEFRDLSFAESETVLMKRLARVRALQLHIAERWDPEQTTQFLQHVQKRRGNREVELFQPEEKSKHALSFILKAFTSALDAHTNYFTPSEANQFMIQVQQRLSGIGAQMRDTFDGLEVVRIVEGTPAAASKLKLKDKIIAVDHEPVLGMEFIEAIDCIRGTKGSVVCLTVMRDQEQFDLELVRNDIVLEESRLETNVEPFADGVIAHLRLFTFYQDLDTSSAQDLARAIEQIKKEHKLYGVILDLRNNAGGLLPQAVSVAGLFMKRGIVVSIQENTGKVHHLREIEGNQVWDGTMLVLVNRASASASEIVAQSLQDYGRALVVGDHHTFGKGTFQTCTIDPINNLKINPQGEYKVTRGRYFTVSGKSPQLNGVFADLVIPGALSYLDIGEEFAKFPLDNEEIEPHYEDTLSDLPLRDRLELGTFYRYQLQAKLTTYTAFIEQLKKNSERRINNSKVYQNFLEDARKKNFDGELLHQQDVQLVEAFNVMKDLIVLVGGNRKNDSSLARCS
jgi:carboxyl-terminal processing protease